MNIVSKIWNILTWIFAVGIIGYGGLLLLLSVHATEAKMHEEIGAGLQQKKSYITTTQYRNEISMLTQENRRLKSALTAAKRMVHQSLVANK